MTLLEQLSQHLQRPVNEATRQRARLHLLDWLACVAGGRQSAVAYLSDDAGPVHRMAALVGNVLEMDDVDREGRLHPGPVIWPAALSDDHDTFEHNLDSAVRGYEAMLLVGRCFDDAHYAMWHPTATAGGIGAAATAVSLAWGDALRCEWAMCLAASVAGGVWHMRHGDSMTKQWHILHAVRTGEEAAALAMGAFKGAEAILEGPQGIFAAMTREPKPMVFAEGWKIEEVSFKPWAACRHAHPVIDCALELRAAGKLTAPFHVETYADAITFCDRPDPKTEAEAKFSLQHAVAVIADGRSAEPADFTPKVIAALTPLRALVSVAEAPEITARYPAHFGARVNGLELIDTRGDPERPVGEGDIIAKMHMLAKWGGLPAEEADRAVELALRGDDAGEITKMLTDWLS